MSDYNELDTGPDREVELFDEALDWVQSTFARTVALKLTPVLLPVLGGAAVWLQDAIGINMNPTVAAAFVISVVVGAAGVVLTYVRNHGRGAAEVLQQVIAQTQAIRYQGEEILSEVDDAPVVPPGLNR